MVAEPAGVTPGAAALSELAAAVKAEARRRGCDLVGIADARPFEVARERTLAWLAGGGAAGMAWLTPERARRASEPAALLPGAASFLAIAVGYRPSEEGKDAPLLPPTRSSPLAAGGGAGVRIASPAGRGRPSAARTGEGVPPTPTQHSALSTRHSSAPAGQVARYARGRDYHDVLKPRLWALVRFLEARLERPVAARVFVDDGPCLDRAVAQRAGLGFFGKNTNLLTRTHGSYVLLGAALTDVPLPADPPAVGDCGACTLCLDACPTGALPAPYRMDSARCISYLTIEHRGPLPAALRPLLGDHLFGCDVCQEVCPWNRLARPTCEPAFAPEVGAGAALDPAEVLAWDEATYRERLRGTPLKRAKYQGLRRNAAALLARAGGTAAEALATATTDPDAVVAEQARWSLGHLDVADAADAR